MKDRTTHEPCVWICLYVWCHRSTCLSAVFLLSISPSAYHPSIFAVSQAYNPLPISPLLFLSKKNNYFLSPRCWVSFIHTSVFHLVSHWSTEEIRQKKVNIWTATKNEREVAFLASVSVMSRPETSSSQNNERWFLPYPIMTGRENCPTILMPVTWQQDWECQQKMAACPNNVSLIPASLG